MTLARSAAAVLAGAMMLGFIDQTLERTLVSVVAGGLPADAAAYLAVRDRPLVLAVTLVTHGLAATLTGYIVARIAGGFEVRHAMATAVLLTVVYGIAFATDNVMLPPVWARAAIVVVTPPALLAGASIRAQARAIQAERGGTPHPEERS
jgi:hypothetical protein